MINFHFVDNLLCPCHVCALLDFPLLLKVVFAVGGDTDTTEWLDIEAGDKNR